MLNVGVSLPDAVAHEMDKIAAHFAVSTSAVVRSIVLDWYFKYHGQKNLFPQELPDLLQRWREINGVSAPTKEV